MWRLFTPESRSSNPSIAIWHCILEGNVSSFEFSVCPRWCHVISRVIVGMFGWAVDGFGGIKGLEHHFQSVNVIWL